MKRLTDIALHLCVIFFFAGVCFSQQDTIYTPIVDTTKGIKDTIPVKGEVDAIIEYSAKDSAVFDIENQRLYLYNEADLKHKEFELKAARIILYRETSVMEAHGIPDTANAGKFTGNPVFIEGDKKYEASTVKYNFKTRTGNITMGTTEIEGGYYLGEKIKKVGEDIYFVKNGRYTTCDKSDPDYYFGSPKMKIIRGDKVVAEPVYLYVDDVPIFAIPLGIFPNHSGRSSGLIAPAYGEDASLGRYLSHLGYFWAINDYIDLTFQGNYFTKGRLDLSGRFRYALRYKLSGSVELGGSRIRVGEETDPDKQFSDEWHIGIDHNQSFNPTTSIAANVNMYSSKTFLSNTSNNLNQLLLQNAVSNVTLTKSWEGTPNLLTVNYYRDQNLQTGEVNQRIPSINFTRSQSYPFRGSHTSLIDLKWYELISYNYSAQLINDDKKKVDTLSATGFTKDRRGAMQQTVQITAPVKFGYFNVSPFVNYYEVWHDKYIVKTFNSLDSTVSVNDKSGIKTYRYFTTGITLNTRIIGLLKTNIFSIKGFRHTLTPSVSYNFQPDFTKPFWHIYNSYADASGRQVFYNQFEKEPFGSAPGKEIQGINFGLGNVFEMKVKETDTTDNKYQLLNVDASIGYNFAADSLKLSQLGISYRTQIASLLNIGGSATFNFYKYVDGVGRINRFLLSTDKKIADLTSFNINMSTSFRSSEESLDTSKGRETEEDEYKGIYNDKPPDFKIPWEVSLNYNYGINKPAPTILTKTSNLSGSFSFSPTRKWKFSFSAGYDIFEQKLTAPYVTIYRDLHCWEMSLNWIPLGEFRGYRFELRVKAPQLQDIRVTKQTNYRGVYQ